MKQLLMQDRTALILSGDDSRQKSLVFTELGRKLNEENIHVRHINNLKDLYAFIYNNTRICAVIFDWDVFSTDLCKEIQKINENMPLFAFTHEHVALDVTLADLDMLRLNFFEYKLNEVELTSLKIALVIEEYISYILPPLTRALFDFVAEAKYSYCTPGHLGGTAFLKSPTGAIFYDFFGGNTFQADVSVSVPELGSLLDHSEKHEEAEKFIAKVFGSDRSYMVTNGTSTANKIVGMYCVSAGDTMLMDRNCHKSLTHLMMMVDVTPIYLNPTRNAYGILGGIPQSEFTEAAIHDKMQKAGVGRKPDYAVVTNSTYDGLFYNTDYIKKTLPCKHIHFDSAWVPYTNFHPAYKGKAGITGMTANDKVVFETHSTHKCLAAFSQASMIHIKGAVDEGRFNEPYMMHTSTSPQYNMVASCEVAAAMMKGNSGKRLMVEAIDIAMNFRKQISQLATETDGWFYKVWQPDKIEEVDCWPLKQNESWHGFKQVDEDHIYLDPIKVTLLLPGLEGDSMSDVGIPASLVAKFLDEHGVIVEKTGPYSMLFLFTIGIDKAKSLKLIRTLADFKRAFDKNLKVKDMLPNLYHEDPHFYETMTLQTLAKGLHDEMRKFDLPSLMYNAFVDLPKMVLTPYKAFQEVIRGKTCDVLLQDLVGEVCAHMILPYPPGVPLILPGEKLTESNKVVLDFLNMLVETGQVYPGFETDIHGLHEKEGEYYATVIDGY